MRYTLLFAVLSLSSAAFAQVCPNVYSSGWYCDVDGYAVHCAYDFTNDQYYENDYIACPLMANSNGCFAGSCNCLYYCARGFQNDDCSCSCSYPWGGTLCNVCLRSNSECGNGGYMNPSSCQCNCPTSCLNGGTQNSNCGCSCPAPWSGARCDVCTRSSSECQNGGYMDSTTCKCVCPNKCQNGGVQDGNCGCSCPAPWTGPKCETCSLTQANCANGATLNSNLCQCNCATPCQNSGTLTKTCDCNCAFPWTGNVCQTCSFAAGHCLNNSTFTGASKCGCDCTNAETCQHGAARMADLSCGCNCINGWGSNDCSTCARDASFCLGNGTFKAAACNCDCSKQGCSVNGKLNERCQCICNGGFKGPDCSVASSAGVLAAPILGVAFVVLSVALLGN